MVDVDSDKENMHVAKKFKHDHNPLEPALHTTIPPTLTAAARKDGTTDLSVANGTTGVVTVSSPATQLPSSSATHASTAVRHSLHSVLRFANTLKALDLLTVDLDKGRTVATGRVVQRSERTNDDFDAAKLLKQRDEYVAEAYRFTDLVNTAIEHCSKLELYDVFHTVRRLKDVRRIGRLRREMMSHYYNASNKCTRQSMLMFLTDLHLFCRAEYFTRLYKRVDACLEAQSDLAQHKIDSYLVSSYVMQWERCVVIPYINGNKYLFYWFGAPKETVADQVREYWAVQDKQKAGKLAAIVIDGSDEAETDNTTAPILRPIARTASVISPSNSQPVSTQPAQQSSAPTVEGAHTADVTDLTADSPTAKPPVKTVFDLCTQIDNLSNSVLTTTVDNTATSVRTDFNDTDIKPVVSLKLQRTFAARMFERAPITHVPYSDCWPPEPLYAHDNVPEFSTEEEVSDVSDDDSMNDVEIIRSPPKTYMHHVYIDKILPSQSIKLSDKHKQLIMHLLPDIDDAYNVDNVVPVRMPELLLDECKDHASECGSSIIFIDDVKPTETDKMADKRTDQLTDIKPEQPDAAQPSALQKTDEATLFVNEPIDVHKPIIIAVGWSDAPVLSSLLSREQRRIKNIQFTALLSYICSSFGLDEEAPLERLQSTKYQKWSRQCATIANGRVYIAQSILSQMLNNRKLSTTLTDSDNDDAAVRDLTIAPPHAKVILGLFANRKYKAGDVVCMYGGVRENAEQLLKRWRHVKTSNMLSHARKIPDCGLVRDGRLWSAAFDRTIYGMQQENEYAPSQSPQPMDMSPVDDMPDASPTASPSLLESSPLYSFNDVKVTPMSNTVKPEIIAPSTTTMDVSEDDDVKVIADTSSDRAAPLRNMDYMHARPVQKVYPSLTPLKLLELMYAELRAGAHRSDLTPGSNELSGGSNERRAKRVMTEYGEVEQMRMALKSSVHHSHSSQVTMHYGPFIDDPVYYTALQAMCVQLNDMLMNTGVGYMSNTYKDKSKHNVRSIEVSVATVPMPMELFYVAVKNIDEHDEIIAPYGNNESRKFRE